jgi:hypothetical protein
MCMRGGYPVMRRPRAERTTVRLVVSGGIA